ncbi:MAG: hypothetical protein KAS66_08050 [Candidatus Omnitrophica bacterium]|nr:hypothetical protein [Candidatus Omnitrophota bacterium]
MTRKGIDFALMVINMKDPEQTQIFSSEQALQKYMEQEELVFKRVEVPEMGSIQVRERLEEKNPTENSSEWVVHYSQKIIKKTDFK